MVLDKLGMGLGYAAKGIYIAGKAVVKEVTSIPTGVKKGWEDSPEYEKKLQETVDKYKS